MNNSDLLKTFRESNEGSRWRQAVDESWFREGLKIALLTVPIATAGDMGTAAANEWRRDGIRRFTDHLLTLGQSPIDRVLTNARSNLNHTV